MDPNRKQWNSSLRPKSLKRIEAERNGTYKKPVPKPMRPRKKPLSLKEVKQRFNIVTAAMLGDKPKVKATKYRKPIAKRAKTNNGWYNWAVEKVWNVRPHRCEVCRTPLGDEERPEPFVFSHLLPRQTYRRYKTDARNIALKCLACHNKWHDQGPEKLKSLPEWKAVCERYFDLRDEANNVSQ